MPLSVAFPALQQKIRSAFDNLNMSAEGRAQMMAVADTIALAVHEYVSQAQVIGTVQVSAGIPVTTAGSPTTQVGATTGPGGGSILSGSLV